MDQPTAHNAVLAFQEACEARSFTDAWCLLDENLKICVIQHSIWVGAIEDADEMQELLDLLVEMDGRGESMPKELREILTEEWFEWLHPYWDSGGVPANDRLIGMDLELVILAKREDLTMNEDGTIDGEQIVPAQAFLVRLVPLTDTTATWQIAAFSDHLPQPGWPPTFGPPEG